MLYLPTCAYPMHCIPRVNTLCAYPMCMGNKVIDTHKVIKLKLLNIKTLFYFIIYFIYFHINVHIIKCYHHFNLFNKYNAFNTINEHIY